MLNQLKNNRRKFRNAIKDTVLTKFKRITNFERITPIFQQQLKPKLVSKETKLINFR